MEAEYDLFFTNFDSVEKYFKFSQVLSYKMFELDREIINKAKSFENEISYFPNAKSIYQTAVMVISFFFSNNIKFFSRLMTEHHPRKTIKD